MSAGRALELLHDLLIDRSREENRHFDDGVDGTLSLKDVDCLTWLLTMLKVCRKMKLGTAICTGVW